MKKIIPFLFLLLSSLIGFSQAHQLKNPVYLLNSLLDSHSEQSMEEVLTYYNFTPGEQVDGFKTYIYPDGTEFLIKMDSTTYPCPVPIIEVRTKGSKKEITKILQETGYKKKGDQYIRGSEKALGYKVAYFSQRKHNGEITLIATLSVNKK